jgi:hypothetical protein
MNAVAFLQLDSGFRLQVKGGRPGLKLAQSGSQKRGFLFFCLLFYLKTEAEYSFRNVAVFIIL